MHLLDGRGLDPTRGSAPHLLNDAIDNPIDGMITIDDIGMQTPIEPSVR